MYHISPDFKEKLRKYVVRGERSLNRVFVVILQGSWSECPQTAHTMNSSIHFPGQWGQSWACWEILPCLSPQLPPAPWSLFPDAGLGVCDLRNKQMPGGSSLWSLLWHCLLSALGYLLSYFTSVSLSINGDNGVYLLTSWVLWELITVGKVLWRWKVWGGIIIIIMKYLPLLLGNFCQTQKNISTWVPNETLTTPTCTHVCTPTSTHTHRPSGIRVLSIYEWW